MAAHAVGYPIVTGCHNVHRSAALRDVGGFAAHDADDLLITIHYRAAGWRGVYVPEILAHGITPVDWAGYVTQQRRWARSVIDMKLRSFPRIAHRLPLVERVVSALHGLYYLYAVGTAFGVAVLAGALATGLTPPLLRASGSLLGASCVLFACDLIRQRYYLDRPREWGAHVCGAIVKLAKWPYVLLAIGDAVVARPRSYATTPKVASSRPARVLLRGHGPAMALVVAAALVGAATGHPPAARLALVAAAYVGGSAALVALERRPAPEPYDDLLATAVQT
jgi:cellulose synthase (UDP-forming)